MNIYPLSKTRLDEILNNAERTRVLVIGDVILDHFIWGDVSRISPEAPVPVVDFMSECYMAGGAANVAVNLATLNVSTELFGLVGNDEAAERLSTFLAGKKVDCDGLVTDEIRPTSVKTRILAHQQQIVRLDRELRINADEAVTHEILRKIESRLPTTDAIIIGDYGKGAVTQKLLTEIKAMCHDRKIWLSMDPKPSNALNLTGLSLLTPNRKEAFELAKLEDSPIKERPHNPLEDLCLLQMAHKLYQDLSPSLLLITLGAQGMLLCQPGKEPFHVPTTAQEVFDVSGAGDTVVASFTMTVAAGASPIEATIISNHAAGVVVGKVGTSTVSQKELYSSFNSNG